MATRSRHPAFAAFRGKPQNAYSRIEKGGADILRATGGITKRSNKTFQQIRDSLKIVETQNRGIQMEVQTYGYIRVSSKEQHEDRQLIAMQEAGVPKRNLFIDKQSGKDFERKGYQRMMKKLKPGDTLFVKSIDRLGRNYDEILEQWRIITKEKQAAIVVLDMPLLDTRQGRDLTGTLIADIVLQLLSYVAQTEREFIHQRQAEGISAAKARGVHFGRLPMEPPPEYEEVYAKWYGGSLSARAAARKLSISHQTFLKWAKNNGRKSVP